SLSLQPTATTQIYTLSLHDALPISARRPAHRPAGAGLPPRLGRHVGRRLERLKVGDEFPDGGGWQQAAVRRHAVRLAVIDRHLRSEEHTSELQSRGQLVCRLLLEKK